MTEGERRRVAELIDDGWQLNVESGGSVSKLKATSPEIGPDVRYVANARRAESTVTGYGVSPWAALTDILEHFALRGRGWNPSNMTEISLHEQRYSWLMAARVAALRGWP